MKRMWVITAALAGILFARAGLADDVETKDAADGALADKADAPATPPTLPSQASERATYVHENIAFGKQGDAQRAAHAQAQDSARDARAHAANAAAHAAAASAAGAASSDAHAAAGQTRAETARTTRSQPTPYVPPTNTGRR
ncbi:MULTISPECIES: hypothetical protein [Anaeromyxobacter]|uniref:hypothetical protein n=2 Tax=Anaeromyxobacteraceae TaxID=1524215 RepID=UPI001F576611|nr:MULTISPECIES: hypothetical protein [unclassified Anaeromyxobacter]